VGGGGCGHAARRLGAGRESSGDTPRTPCRPLRPDSPRDPYPALASRSSAAPVRTPTATAALEKMVAIHYPAAPCRCTPRSSRRSYTSVPPPFAFVSLAYRRSISSVAPTAGQAALTTPAVRAGRRRRWKTAPVRRSSPCSTTWVPLGAVRRRSQDFAVSSPPGCIARCSSIPHESTVNRLGQAQWSRPPTPPALWRPAGR